MLAHELLADRGILILRPGGPLAAGDFEGVARVVDPWIEAHGNLRGMLVETRAFPGWEDFAGLAGHLRFVRGHHRRIRRIAIVSDSPLATIGPALARHFVAAELRHFDFGQREAALAWLEGP